MDTNERFPSFPSFDAAAALAVPSAAVVPASPASPEAAPDREDIVAFVRRRVEESIGKDRMNIEIIAEELHVNSRTVQRWLLERGTSFREILAEAQRTWALRWVREGLTNRQIVVRLDFSEARGFLRAFRRWTGMTPSEYRMQLAKESAADPSAFASVE